MPSKEQLSSVALRDPLSWGIQHIDLLEDKQWEVSSRRWSIEPYRACNPWDIERDPTLARKVSIIKSTQAGISTMALTKALHFATNWAVRIGYTLPRQQDLIDFVSTRLDPMLEASPYLTSLRGTPDSSHSKRIGNSYLFFMEMSVESRMMPIDSLYVDEIDLSNPDNVSTAQNRMDASRWRLQTNLSTPTISNYGIDALYGGSDMRRWFVKCPKCGYWQTLDWELNLRVTGNPSDPKRVDYICVKCSQELTVEYIQTGTWVPEHPERSDDHIGYHISQMMTTPASSLYKIYRDPQTKIVEFYRKRLGKPYDMGGGSIERDDFLVSCFDEPYMFEPMHDGKSNYYMGVDQGNELQVVIYKNNRESTRRKVVHIEIVPPQRGFERIGQLIRLFKPRRIVIDGNPNRHPVLDLQKHFPGRLLIADYSEQKQVYKVSKQNKATYFTNVSIDRTAGLDSLMEAIKEGEWQLPGNPPNLPQDVELLIDHVTALKRDVETRRTNSGEVQVGIYRKIRADHLGHSMLYAMIAERVDRGRGLKISVVGKNQATQEEQQEDEGTPDKETMLDIVSFLAEVPNEQLVEYLSKNGEDGYEAPFPLSHKLTFVSEFRPEHVRWVMEIMVDTRKTQKLY